MTNSYPKLRDGSVRLKPEFIRAKRLGPVTAPACIRKIVFEASLVRAFGLPAASVRLQRGRAR